MLKADKNFEKNYQLAKSPRQFLFLFPQQRFGQHLTSSNFTHMQGIKPGHWT
jgi:hypothetical protein